MNLNSVYNTAMEKAMSALWERQQTISHNIANEDTPGYKAKRIEFESMLKTEMDSILRNSVPKRESISRLRNTTTREYELGGLAGRVDGNSVDLDSEYIEMARTRYQYYALEQKVAGHYTNLKYVINGGR
ncbi:flagellar basal body rod protein FlgB [Ruminococcaceae bacterium OttesenSCG-928-L11]|nr:flagellar basal body rod protein FlgB [Ruminococcaceae bacterium OttesenSCG-928-L11]